MINSLIEKSLKRTAQEFAMRAAAIVLQGNQVVLIERRRDGETSYYVFPGGKVESGETLEAAAQREIMEEP